MIDTVLQMILNLVHLILGMISTVLLGTVIMAYIKANKDLFRGCFRIKIIALAFLSYFIIVMIIGLAPMNR